MRYTIVILSVLLIAAKTTDTLDSLKQRYAEEEEKIQLDYKTYCQNVLKLYSRVLQTEMRRYKAAGRLDDLLDIQKELSKVGSETYTFEGDPTLPKSTQTQRTLHQKKYDSGKVLKSQAMFRLQKGYVQRLRNLTRELTIQGMISEAREVQKAADGVTLYMADPASATAKPTKQHEVEIFANGDDDFVMYLNGKLLLSGSGERVATITTKIGRDDILTVKSTQTRGDKGFACVIRCKSARQVYTTPGEWKSYFPENSEKWFS